MYIDIVEPLPPTDDALHCRRTFRFYVRIDGGGDDPVRATLDEYFVEQRPTTRHKWRCVRGYVRQSHRRGAMEYTVPLDEVPWPDDLAARVTAFITARVRVDKTWTR